MRLWIDRSFTIRGAGTVVTGTLPAGTVRNGQELLLTPSAEPVRVRGLQALGEPADQVAGVARVALNLRGVPADLPARGMALIEPGRWTLATELDVRITPPAADPQPKFPPELLLHIGAARTHARLRILGPAGGTAPAPIYARLRLREPLPLHAGDRVLLRDPGAAGLAIYGATVLDPAPPPLARRGAGAAAVRELSGWPDVPTAADLLRRHKLLRAPALAAAGLTELPAAVAGDWRADPAHWAALRAELPAVVADFCARDPLAPGMPTEAARASLKLPSRDLITALASGDIVQDGGYLRIFTRHAGDVGPSRAARRPSDQSATSAPLRPARPPVSPGPPRTGSAPSAPRPASLSAPPDGSRPPSPPPSRRSSTTSPGNRSPPLTPNACARSASTPRPWRPRPGPGCCSASPTWSCSPPAPPIRRPRRWPNSTRRSPPRRRARRWAPPAGWPSRCSSTSTAPGSPNDSRATFAAFAITECICCVAFSI